MIPVNCDPSEYSRPPNDNWPIFRDTSVLYVFFNLSSVLETFSLYSNISWIVGPPQINLHDSLYRPAVSDNRYRRNELFELISCIDRIIGRSPTIRIGRLTARNFLCRNHCPVSVTLPPWSNLDPTCSFSSLCFPGSKARKGGVLGGATGKTEVLTTHRGTS